jgi:hypothetical protein
MVLDIRRSAPARVISRESVGDPGKSQQRKQSCQRETEGGRELSGFGTCGNDRYRHQIGLDFWSRKQIGSGARGGEHGMDRGKRYPSEMARFEAMPDQLFTSADASAVLGD